MKINNELYWPCGEPGEFMQGSMVDLYESENKKWLEMNEPRYDVDDARVIGLYETVLH